VRDPHTKCKFQEFRGISKMAGREICIRVEVRGGEAFPCDPEWDIDKAELKIRAGYDLSGGYIRDENNNALDGKAIIKDIVGRLTFVGGRDLPPPLLAPVTAQIRPAGMSSMLSL
jgi:hypothetical protein